MVSEAVKEKVKKHIELTKELKDFLTPHLNWENLKVEGRLREFSFLKLKEKLSELNGQIREKNKLIRKIIGQMYNGVLIQDELTIRRGKIYRFRAQYEPSLNSIKTSIMNNLTYLVDKLSDDDLEILEFILGFVEDGNEEKEIVRKIFEKNCHNFIEKKTLSGRSNEKLEFEIPEIDVISELENKNDCLKVETEKINGFCIDMSGDVEFIFINEEKESGRVYVNSYLTYLLLEYYSEIINEKIDKIFLDVSSAVVDMQENVNKIKEKARNIMLLLELKETELKL